MQYSQWIVTKKDSFLVPWIPEKRLIASKTNDKNDVLNWMGGSNLLSI